MVEDSNNQFDITSGSTGMSGNHRATQQQQDIGWIPRSVTTFLSFLVLSTIIIAIVEYGPRAVQGLPQFLERLKSVSPTAISFAVTITSAYLILGIYAVRNKNFIRALRLVTGTGLRLATESAQYTKDARTSRLAESIENIQSKMEELQRKNLTSDSVTLDLSEDEKDGLVEKAQHSLQQGIEDELRRKLNETNICRDVRDLGQNALERLSNQVVVLGSRANLSLRYGIIFAVAGLIIVFVAFFVFRPELTGQNQALNSTWTEVVLNYLPRFSLVLIVELIAFFFLRLYSKALEELRYVQNETTNIEFRLISLETALATGDNKSAAAIMKLFAETDRNSIIDVGQTTVEIEKVKASNSHTKQTLDALTGILHGNEKGSIWRTNK